MKSPFLNVSDEVFENARHLTSFQARKGFRLAYIHQYTHSDGSPWWWVLRLEGSESDPATGKKPKSIWPLRKTETGFELKRPEFGPEGAPLYGLHLLRNYPHDLVVVVEGEKCADHLVGPGFIAITWAGGANAVDRTDWTPVARRRVALWPDNDESGFQAMDKVRDILRGLDAHVVTLDVAALGLPPKGDCIDWMERVGGDPLSLPLVHSPEMAVAA